MDHIQRCPFCLNDQVRPLTTIMGLSHTVYCQECHSCGPEAGTEEEAIAQWNRRPSQKTYRLPPVAFLRYCELVKRNAHAFLLRREQEELEALEQKFAMLRGHVSAQGDN